MICLGLVLDNILNDLKEGVALGHNGLGIGGLEHNMVGAIWTKSNY